MYIYIVYVYGPNYMRNLCLTVFAMLCMTRYLYLLKKENIFKNILSSINLKYYVQALGLEIINFNLMRNI